MSDSVFAIDVEKLRGGSKIELDVRETPAALDLVDLPGVVFEGEISGHLTYSMSGTDIFIRGRLNARAQSECVRCLEPSTHDLNVKVKLNYLGKSPEDDPSAFDEEIEELDVDYYSGDHLDPLPEIRDAILLELPDLPVCAETCKGLCPQCGANMNLSPCTCKSTEPEPEPEAETWKAKLKGFKVEE